jgi:general secretion pathway protein D
VRRILFVGLAIVLVAGSTAGSAQNLEAALPASSSGGIPMSELVMAMSKKTGKKFVLEPHVQAVVSVAPDPAKLSYDEFLTVLQVYGFVAVERGDVVMVMPDSGARTLPVPLVTGNSKHPDAEVVTRIIHVRSLPAAQLVPILRPLIPQLGHLAALTCTNDLILVDRYANARRLESIIQALDTGQAFKPESCSDATQGRAPPRGSND